MTEHEQPHIVQTRRIETEAERRYPNNAHDRQLFIDAATWVITHPGILIGDPHECPHCHGPLMWDEWGHSESGWECVDCNRWYPAPEETSWSADDYAESFFLTYVSGETTDIEYDNEERNEHAHLALDRKSLEDLALTAAIISTQLPGKNRSNTVTVPNTISCPTGQIVIPSWTSDNESGHKIQTI